MSEVWSSESLDLLAGPAPAVLTTYRKSGAASVSPVWFRFHDEKIEIVIAEGDVKLRQLASDPRCSLLVFETRPPFRGVRVEGVANLRQDTDGQARLEIASRYLGLEDGRRFTDQRTTPGMVLHVEPAAVGEWDLRPTLPAH